MNNEEKAILRQIVKDIPEEELKYQITFLWRKYAVEFEYGTFRKYLEALRER